MMMRKVKKVRGAVNNKAPKAPKGGCKEVV